MSWCCSASKAGARVHMAMAFISQLLAMCLMCLEPLRVTVCTPEGEESDLASGSARRPQLGVLSKGTRASQGPRTKWEAKQSWNEEKGKPDLE